MINVAQRELSHTCMCDKILRFVYIYNDSSTRGLCVGCINEFEDFTLGGLKERIDLNRAIM